MAYRTGRRDSAGRGTKCMVKFKTQGKTQGKVLPASRPKSRDYLNDVKIAPPRKRHEGYLRYLLDVLAESFIRSVVLGSNICFGEA